MAFCFVGIEKAWNLLAGKVMGWARDFVLLLPNLAVAVAVLIGFWLLAKLARGLLRRLLNRISHSEQVNRVLCHALFLALVAAGLFIALGILGLQKTVASLLAGAGIIGLALGFAFQDIAANFMAGIFLSIEHPFRAGHLIESKDIQGIVRRVHLRWTEIRTPQGQIVLVPNKQVFENPITNFSSTGQRRVDIKVGVSYGDDLDKVKRVAVEALEQVSTRKPDTEVELFFEEFGELDQLGGALLDRVPVQAVRLSAGEERGGRAAEEGLRRQRHHPAVPHPHPRLRGQGGRDALRGAGGGRPGACRRRG